MTKTGTKTLDWTMDVIKSFEGETFTSHSLVDRWGNYAPPRYQPNATGITVMLKRLISKGLIRKTGNKVKYTIGSGTADYTPCYVEVTLEENGRITKLAQEKR
jgi:hypothetical protein